MKTKLAVLLVTLLAIGGSLFAQGQDSIRAVGGVLTINLVPSSNRYKVFVDQTITSTVFTNPIPGAVITVLFVQDATGHSVAFGGNIAGACSVTATASATTGCQFTFDSANNQWTGVGGGSSSPSSPAAQCNGGTTGPSDKYWFAFWGFAPQDCGAKGDSVWLGDCGMASNNHVTCPTSTPFKSTDVGKYFEITSSTSLPITVINGTISAFNSSSDVTVSQTAGSTFTNQRLRYGTDDTAALQAWVNLMIASLSSTGARGQVRGGYVPRGIYLTKQPLRFVLPSSVGTGECGPNGGLTGSASGIGFPCNIWIIGDGFFSSQIWVATAGVFNWGCATNGNVGAIYFTGAAGLQQTSVNLSQVGLLSDGSQHNTSGCTNGDVGALFFDGTTHDNVSGILVQDFDNSTGKMAGMVVNCGFESYYQQSAIEGNDKNLRLNANNGSNAPCANIAGESGNEGKLVFDTVFLETPGFLVGSALGENLQIGTGAATPPTLFQTRFRNVDFEKYTATQQLAGVDINGATTVANDHIEFDGCRFNDGGAGDVGAVVLNGSSTYVVEFHGCDIATTATNAINSVDANATARFFGGSITGAVVNAGNIIFTQVMPSGALSGAGTTNFNAVGIAFANLPAGAANGSTIGCTNCTTASNPCTGASTGAIAVRQNGAWVCK